MIKLKFSNPVISLEGKSTFMCISVLIEVNGDIKKIKRFTRKITLKEGDKYDLNCAVRILKTMIEKDAYAWAHKLISKELKSAAKYTHSLSTFAINASHIIKHDEEYLKALLEDNCKDINNDI